jgi:hypothetical protein
MLTAFGIENFKGFSTRRHIEFAPLTLLFGANSAGKSTILQALLYLYELLEHGEADVDLTELSGIVLELGGFARFVHRHEIERPIMLRAEFETLGLLERFGRDLTRFPFPDLDDEIERAWLEVRVRYHQAQRRPLVDRVTIGVRGETTPLVWLEVGATLRDGDPLYVRVNLGHPLISEQGLEVAEVWDDVALPEAALRQPPADEWSDDDGFSADAGIVDRTFGDPRLRPIFAVSRSRLSALPPLSEPLRVLPFGDELTPEREATLVQVRTFLEMVILGTSAQLVTALRDTLYVGPLRAIPPRGFLYERAGRLVSWADGLAAWDALLADNSDLVERTNAWLERLGAGCRIVVQQLFEHTASAEELSVDHVDKTVRRLLLDMGDGTLVLPSEVGAGVSQIVPAIVAALEARRFAMIEQPEIHVHPAVQVGLGDLFIEAATRAAGRGVILVETHSEHLILRVLRRIRETTDQKLAEGVPAFKAEWLSVLYVENGAKGVVVRRLGVDESGEFVDRWPRGFFDERFEEVYGS